MTAADIAALRALVARWRSEAEAILTDYPEYRASKQAKVRCADDLEALLPPPQPAANEPHRDGKHFICPECGSGHFGAWHEVIGCHGETFLVGVGGGGGCQFSGRREDVMHDEVPEQLKKARALFDALTRRSIKVCPATLRKLLDALEPTCP